MMDRTTGTVDAENNPRLDEKYMCQGLLTNALAKQPIVFDKHEITMTTISGSSEIMIFCLVSIILWK